MSKYADIAIACFGFLILMTAGITGYTKGYRVAEAEWSVKLSDEKLRNTEELNKAIQDQIEANAKSKKLEADRIATMEAENRRLEELVGELQNDEKLDPNRDHGGISHDSGMRINKVR